MKEEEPGIIPPKHLRLPQRSPQHMAEGQQRLFRVEQPSQLEQQLQPPIYTPKPQQDRPPQEPTQPDWQWVPQTPMPPFFSHIETQLPNTPPILEAQGAIRGVPYRQDTPMPARPALYYVPAKSRRKEFGTGEMLLGCFVLLVIGILVLLLLYYIATPF